MVKKTRKMAPSRVRSFLLLVVPVYAGLVGLLLWIRGSPDVRGDVPTDLLDIFLLASLPLFLGLFVLLPVGLFRLARGWATRRGRFEGKERGIGDWLVDHYFLLGVSLANWAMLAVPLVVATIYMAVIYSWFEALVGGAFLLAVSAVFAPAVVITRRGRSFAYPVVTHVMGLLLFFVLGLLNWVFLALGTLNALAILVALGTRHRSRTPVASPRPATTLATKQGALPLPSKPSKSPGFPGKRVAKAAVVLGLIVSAVAVPFSLLERLDAHPVEYTLPRGNEPEVFWVDWTWADDYDDPRGINASTLAALEACHALPRVNVSLTIALPEEFFNAFAYEQVRRVLARGIPVNLMPLVPKEPDYFYINDFTVAQFNQTWGRLRAWLEAYNLTTNITSVIVDLEPNIRDVTAIVRRNFEPWEHRAACQRLEAIVTDMQAYFHPRGTRVIGATFGYLIDDFIDGDDSVLRLLAQATWPPTNWDALGFMCYERGGAGHYSIYAQAQAIDHYFGDAGVPYLISKQPYADVLTEFQILRNVGFNYTGIWALQDFLARETERGRNATASLLALHEALNVPSDVTFQLRDAESGYIHAGILLLDLILWDPPRFPLGRQMGTPVGA